MLNKVICKTTPSSRFAAFQLRSTNNIFNIKQYIFLLTYIYQKLYNSPLYFPISCSSQIVANKMEKEKKTLHITWTLDQILKRKEKIEKGDTILRYIKEIKTLCVLLHVCTLSLNVKHIIKKF